MSESQNKLGIVTCMPCAGDINPLAAKAYFATMAQQLAVDGVPIIRLDPSPTSNLAMGFNRALCFALNLKEKGLCTHFAMLHADIEPSEWWLDTLWQEMQATGAHWIAAASPIKDSHGTTSTAIGKDNNWNPWARITMHELHELPETFSIDDLGPDAQANGFKLLLNTGCMLIDLRPDYWSRVGDGGELSPHFEIRNRIVYIPGEGYQAQTDTEDWLLSRIVSDNGGKLVCTRKVVIKHYGPIPFTSAKPWGDWQQDQAGGRAMERQLEERLANSKIHEHGYWMDNLPDGAIYDTSLCQALIKLWKEENPSVVDLGCGRGHYLKDLVAAGYNACGYDGRPDTAKDVPNAYVADLAEPLNIGQWDSVLCLEVGEHIPEQYSNQFLDNVCSAAREQVVISWALPGQPGHGHVNCQTNDWVQAQMESRGFQRNTVVETLLREAASISFFKNTLMVYDRFTTCKSYAEEVVEKHFGSEDSYDDNSDTEQRAIRGSCKPDEVCTTTLTPNNACVACGSQQSYDVRRLAKSIIDCENKAQLTIKPDLTPKSTGRRVKPRRMVTYHDLVDDSLRLASILPSEVRAVLGISRKGMIPAAIIAERLHLQLGETLSYARRYGFMPCGKRNTVPYDGGMIVVVDDGVGSGKSMLAELECLRECFPKTKFVSAAVHIIDPSNPGVDYWASMIGTEQLQETEFLNTYSTAQFMVDLDGVICQNPPINYENEDEGWWSHHFETVQPLYLPRLVPVHSIVTSRLEKYRDVTTDWLYRWGVKYGNLIMHPAKSALERDMNVTSHGIRKAHFYNQSDASLFVESSYEQAQQIKRLSGRPVFCVETGTML